MLLMFISSINNRNYYLLPVEVAFENNHFSNCDFME